MEILEEGWFSKRSAESCNHKNGNEPNVEVQFFGSSRGKKVEINNPNTAMSIDTVYRCVNILSGTIASLPLQHLKYDKFAEVFKLDEGSNLNYIFSRKANEWQNFNVLMQNAIISMLLRGNAYLLPVYDRGELERIYLLNPDSVAYDLQKNIYRVYDINKTQQLTYYAHEIIHLKNPSLDGGYTGVSTIQYATRVLSLSATADEQALSELGDGNKLKGFIAGGNPAKGMGAIQDKSVDEVADRLNREVQEGRSIMRMPGSVEFTPLTITPADAQLLETRKFSPYSICRFFGVPPEMAFVSLSSNYKASENNQETFLNQCLKPLITQIETEFMTKLIHGGKSVQLRSQIKFYLPSLFSMDLKSWAEYGKTSIESGALTPNEFRKMSNRQPVIGGDEMFISCNVAPINSAKIKGETTQTKTENGDEESSKSE